MVEPIDPGLMRTMVLTAGDDNLVALGNTVRAALEGESNDAEHDALVDVALALGIDANTV